MKQWLRRLMHALALVCAGAGLAIAVAPTAEVEIEAMSPRMIEEENLGALARPTSGLPTVVVGYRVYLKSHAFDPTTHVFAKIASSAWTMEYVPTGSARTVGALSSKDTVSFVPDVEGSYQVGLVVTNDSGQTSQKALLWITAAKYVGVGTIGGGTPNTLAGQCGTCHAEVIPGWNSTSHATAAVNFVNKTAAYYTAACLSCHALGYDSVYTTGGLDPASSFVFPASKHGAGGVYATNYDSILATQPAQAKAMNIQCESCHGPGSRHVAAKDKNQISWSFDAGVCAQCHDEPSHHPEPIAWDVSRHANIGEIANGGHANGSGCSRCHTAQGFVNETIRGGAAATYDHPDPITCAACHDPHDGTAPANLRRGSVAAACDGCHTLRLSSHSGLHHSHQGSMIDGKDGKELPGYEYPNSAHSAIADKCAECHMAPKPASLPHGVVGGHSFAIVGTDTTGGAHEVLNDTGCIPCHGNVSLSFVELSQAKVHKLLDSLNAMLPTYPKDMSGFKKGEPVFSADSLTTAEVVASYNWRFVYNDGSFGVHNVGYATALLKASIAELWATRAAGDIVSVSDVPNDQGKMVRVLWNAFASEKAAMATITQYSVWRWNATGDWDFVGSVPATSQTRYGLDVPTLYDSTADAGIVWTKLKIAANTTDPKVVYWSEADSGYSKDNLEPSVPGKAKYGLGKLTWNRSPEPDVRYYAIYRTAIGSAFGDQPYATTIDTHLVVDAPYRYGIVAVDFAGNQSEKAVVDVPVSVAHELPTPATTGLVGNAPNPFNPTTVVRYQLHESARVSLAIYNVLGQPVRTLVSGTMPAGLHSVVWDGLDDTGLNVSSGTYIYVLTTDTGYREARRMLLLR